MSDAAKGEKSCKSLRKYTQGEARRSLCGGESSFHITVSEKGRTQGAKERTGCEEGQKVAPTLQRGERQGSS